MSSPPAVNGIMRTDGNFRLPSPAVPLAFTGERLTSSVAGQIEFEHYHRYCLARDLCDRRDVLDIASGEGYGSALLAGVARSVVGIEIDAGAVAHATANYVSHNLRFVRGDALALPLADASVDVAVSFETLEHVADHEQFISEIRRVLRPGGVFVVSTPDRAVYSAPGVDPNPYHVLELNEPEFRTLMGAHFGTVCVLAQRALLGSVLAAPGAPIWRSYERRGRDTIEASSGLARAQYLVAIATDGPLPAIASSAYLDARVVHSVVHMADSYPAVQAHAAELERQLHSARHEAALSRNEAAAANNEVTVARNDSAIARDEAEAARREAADARAAAAAAENRAAVDREAAEAARQGAQAADAATAAIRQEHQRYQAAVERARDLLRGELEEAEHSLAMEREDAARLRRDLGITLASTSWRITAPLRRLAERHPRLVDNTLGLVHRHPNGRRTVLWLVRSIWRVLTLRRPLPRRPSVIAPLHAAVDPVRRMKPVSWFFIGDTLDWLASHAHLTGVGKVTTELFAAAWASGGTGPAWYPAVAAADGVGLSAFRGRVADTSPAATAFRETLQAIPASESEPQAGDHVLFTGVVWNPTHVALFARLRDNAVRFSVLVHDIIPVENAEFTTTEHRAGFIAWLRATVRDAEVIFVSCEHVRARLAAWCAVEGLAPRRPIAIVAFGDTMPDAPARGGRLRKDIRKPFVLSVGTIDRRKNQALLCRAWTQLVADLGAARVPQLVLVGRDDLHLARADAGVRALAAQGAIRILEDVSDTELDALYRAALFTAFPSLSEGHGLPVADSLAYGKLPVAADLPPIRAHAGELAWYFDPTDAKDAYATLRRAIERDDEREAAEQRIGRTWRPRSWQAAAQAMDALLAGSTSQTGATAAAPVRIAASAAAPSLPRLDIPFARLRLIAGPWCSSDPPEVSILIVNWNASDMTLACVRHIWAYTTGVTYEILIADNGSTPDEVAKLRAINDVMPGLRIFSLKANRYFGEANNILAENASGRLLCLLNNDVFVSPGWLQGLCAVLNDNPKTGAVGPVFLFPDDTIQEAGATMTELGFPERHSRGQMVDAIAALRPRKVDYVSAATLLVSRDLFMEAGGFDLAYEPAYYEDVDLCLKLAALGHEVWLCPDVTVSHVEGFSTSDAIVPTARKRALGDLNRGKFVSRWGDYLQHRDPAALQAVLANFMAPAPASFRPQRLLGRKRALIFTPYMLTPGGGERYLLTVAMALSRDHDVTIATPHPYSRLRLRNLGCEFGIDLSACSTEIVANLGELPEFDVMVAMGNMIVPPIAAEARSNIFLCQFPFALLPEERLRGERLSGYEQIVVYSDYARHHVLNALAFDGLPDLPVTVVYPPVPQMRGDARRKKPMILTVGRFFVGGHVKRHDLLLEAFRTLLRHHGGEVEFHIAGSSMARPEDIDYLDRLRAMAADLPVVLHVNCSAAELASLYRDAAVYWHGTGLAADLQSHPEYAEHFGISIVEAMSAECVAFAFDAGGPREIITDGVDGFLYETVADLIGRTLEVIAPDDSDRRIRIGVAASQRAKAFTQDRFVDQIRAVCRTDALIETGMPAAE